MMGKKQTSIEYGMNIKTNKRVLFTCCVTNIYFFFFRTTFKLYVLCLNGSNETEWKVIMKNP